MGKGQSDEEALYVSSILASFAQTSRCEKTSLPPFSDLSEVFDNFVVENVAPDSGLLEIAGSQSLLLSGFFRDQMRRRHSVRWYDHLGSDFFYQAGKYSLFVERKGFFQRFASNFGTWALVCSELSRELRYNRFLLRLPDTTEPPS